MPHYSEYKCTNCNQITLKELLQAKKVVFSPIGAGTKITKSRTVAWLCNECLELDEDWKREKFKGSPGLKSPALERVRAAEEELGGIL